MFPFRLFQKRSFHIRSFKILPMCGFLILTFYVLSIFSFNNPMQKREVENTSTLLLNIVKEINHIDSFYFEKINKKSYPTVITVQEEIKWNNLTAFALQEELVHKVYCPSSRVEEDGWTGHFIKPDNVNPKTNFIPTKLEESPNRSAPKTPTNFKIGETDFCTKKPKLKAVAIVPTAIINTERRHVTRQTWGSVSEELGIIFFVGTSRNKEENEIIANESQKYRDIVQGNYADLYQFLVYKNLNAFHWVTKYCPNVQWVVHADDDCIFNVRKFVHFINNFNYSNPIKYIFCSLQCDSNPERNESKSTVDRNMYPYNNYPIYCSGFLWFTSVNVIKSLLKVVSQVRYLWIDDVFVTGLLAERANISRYSILLGNSVEASEIENNFGWMSDGRARVEDWKKVETFYSKYF